MTRSPSTRPGTSPGEAINGLSAQVLLEVVVDIADQTPQLITQGLIDGADRVVVLGREAQVRTVDGTPVDYWDTDEPSDRGIDGIDRMRLVRDFAKTLTRDRTGLQRRHG